MIETLQIISGMELQQPIQNSQQNTKQEDVKEGNYLNNRRDDPGEKQHVKINGPSKHSTQTQGVNTPLSLQITAN